ncbi:hypothetical protein Pelo_11154 [Pelomyxa schiedti]|nr:hypothetical protein Pelo_11154 [Pelomyxa schiedti]
MAATPLRSQARFSPYLVALSSPSSPAAAAASPRTRPAAPIDAHAGHRKSLHLSDVSAHKPGDRVVLYGQVTQYTRGSVTLQLIYEKDCSVLVSTPEELKGSMKKGELVTITEVLIHNAAPKCLSGSLDSKLSCVIQIRFSFSPIGRLKTTQKRGALRTAKAKPHKHYKVNNENEPESA